MNQVMSCIWGRRSVRAFEKKNWNAPAIICTIRELLTAWGVPQNHVVYGIAALGDPAPAPAKELKKTGKIVFAE